MDCGKLMQKSCTIVFTKFMVSLWSDGFSFRPIWALRGSFAVMVLAFVDSSQHPPFVLVDASARQLHFFWLLPFDVFLGFHHSTPSSLDRSN